MKIEILYRSMTGHSKKIARAIGKVLGANPKDIKKKPMIENVDLAFVVGGIYSGASLKGMLDYIATLKSENVKRVALVTSSCRNTVGQDQVKKILESNGINVVGEYKCLGNFLFLKMGHPNKSEILRAVEFARKIVSGEKE